MLREQQPKRHWVCRYGQVLINVINLVLLMLLMLQIPVAWIFYHFERIPVHGMVQAKLNEALKAYDVHASWESMDCDLGGRVFLRKFHLSPLNSQGVGDPIVQCEMAMAQLDTLYLLAGKVKIDALKAEKATLYCPPKYSASGLNEPLFRELAFHLKNIREQWVLKSFLAKVFNVSINASGTFPIKTKGAERESGVDLKDYYGIVKEITKYSMDFAKVESPVVYLHFLPGEGNRLTADVALYADGVKEFFGITTGPLGVNLADFRLDNWKVHGQTRLRTDFLKYKTFAEARNVHLRCAPYEIDFERLSLPRKTMVSVGNLRTNGLLLENIGGSVSASTVDRLQASLVLRCEEKPVQVNGTLDLKDLSAKIDLDSRLMMSTLLSVPEVRDKGLGEVFTIEGHPPKLLATIFLEEGFVLDRIKFHLETGVAKFRGSPFQNIICAGVVDMKMIDVTTLIMENPNYRMAGSYAESFEDKSFRVRLKGNIHPPDINPSMRNWWDKLWPDFQFNGPLPNADIDVYGHWNAVDEIRAFISASGEQIAYKGLEMDRCAVKLRVVPGAIELFDLVANRPEGQARGKIQWFYYPQGPLKRSIHYGLSSEFDLKAFSKLLDKAAASVASDFVLGSNPEITVRGGYFRRRVDNQWSSDFLLSGKINEPLVYMGYPLEYLSFRARLDNEHAHVDSLRFGFSGGAGFGSFDVDANPGAPANAPRQLSLNLSIEDADYEGALGALENLEGSGPNGSDHSEKIATGGSKDSGKLSISINTNGTLGDINSFVGYGSLFVKGANLKKIRLLGGLSRLFENTWVNFTTVDLSDAAGNFELTKNEIRFPQLIVTGDNDLVKAKGVVTRPEKNLDFRVKLYLGHGKKRNFIKKVITLPTTALGKALEVNLHGSYEDPKWKFAFFDTRNAFNRSREASEKEEGDKGKSQGEDSFQENSQ